MKQEDLVPILSKVGDGKILDQDSPDVSIIPCSFDSSLCLVSSTDFFTPVSQDPYVQGRIAIANVLSDMYAVGLGTIDSVLMILTLSTLIPPESREIVTSEMIRGFNDGCTLAGTKCTGGQTVFNPWPLIGGTASTIVKKVSILRSDNLQSGDVLVLTKPLGTQIVGNLALWLLDDDKWQNVVSKLIDVETAKRAIKIGEESMMRLNRTGAALMQECGAHGCTDVTGFGILGHAKNLAHIQKESVDIEITRLPIIKGLVPLQKGVTVDYRLTKGLSAETSGGLLIAFPPDKVEVYMRRLEEVGEPPAWIVGRVVRGTRQARIQNESDLVVVEV